MEEQWMNGTNGLPSQRTEVNGPRVQSLLLARQMGEEEV
jgi:hypothetical protein